MSDITHFTAVAVGINSHLSTDANMPEVANFATAKKYLKRGVNDKVLVEFHALASESPNKWQVIETKANFIHGAGLELKEEPPIDPATALPTVATTELLATNLLRKELYKAMELDDYMPSAAYQLSFADELNVLVEWETAASEVPILKVLDNNDVRVATPAPTDRTIKAFWVSTSFGKSKTVNLEVDAKALPAFDPKQPKKYPMSIIHVIMPKPGQRFYGLPSWWGTKKWTEVTNRIPEYYEATMANGSYLTYHYKFPKSRYDIEGKSDEEIKNIKTEDFKNLTDTISGVDKANKMIFSEVEFNDMNKQVEETKIEKIDNAVNDKAFIEMGEMGFVAQLSGHGVGTRLAGMQIGGNMGSSGKEIISEADFMQDYLMQLYRAAIVKPINMVADAIGKPVDFAVKRIQSYTFDSTPVKSTANPNT
jgi:hypothetical protein